MIETAIKYLHTTPGKLLDQLAHHWTLPSSGCEPTRLYEEIYRILIHLGVPEDPLLDALALSYFGREKAWDKLPGALKDSGRIVPYLHRIEKHRMRRHGTLLKLESGYWLFYLAESKPNSLPLSPEEYRWLSEGQGAPEVLQGLARRGAFVENS
jgi:hypothetical protein